MVSVIEMPMPLLVQPDGVAVTACTTGLTPVIAMAENASRASRRIRVDFKSVLDIVVDE